MQLFIFCTDDSTCRLSCWCKLCKSQTVIGKWSVPSLPEPAVSEVARSQRNPYPSIPIMQTYTIFFKYEILDGADEWTWNLFHVCYIFHPLISLLPPSPNSPVQPVPAPVQDLLPPTTNDKVTVWNSLSLQWLIVYFIICLISQCSSYDLNNKAEILGTNFFFVFLELLFLKVTSACVCNFFPWMQWWT